MSQSWVMRFLYKMLSAWKTCLACHHTKDSPHHSVQKCRVQNIREAKHLWRRPSTLNEFLTLLKILQTKSGQLWVNPANHRQAAATPKPRPTRNPHKRPSPTFPTTPIFCFFACLLVFEYCLSDPPDILCLISFGSKTSQNHKPSQTTHKPSSLAAFRYRRTTWWAPSLATSCATGKSTSSACAPARRIDGALGGSGLCRALGFLLKPKKDVAT